jgi:hypothetical protein
VPFPIHYSPFGFIPESIHLYFVLRIRVERDPDGFEIESRVESIAEAGVVI